MSFNLVELVKEQLTDSIMGQVSNALGGSADNSQKAVSGAIPAILGGLLSRGANNEGAGAILSQLNNLDAGILGDLAGSLGKKDFADKGASMLDGMLGGGMLGNLVKAVSGFSGLEQSSSKSLLGMLTPIIFSVIKGKLGGGAGLSAASLMDMLNGQKKNILSAVPQGFSSQLESSGFSAFADLGSAADAAVDAAKDAVSDVSDAAKDAVDTVSQKAATVATSAQAAPEQGSPLGWLLPVLLIAGLGILGWNIFNKPQPVVDPMVDSTQTTETTESTATSEVVEGATEATSEVVEGATEATSEAVEGATEATSEAVEGATEATSEAVEGATEVVESATEVVEGASEAVEGATEATSEAVEGATEATSEAVEGATEVVESATEVVEGASEAVEGATEATSEVVEGATEATSEAVEGATEVVESATEVVEGASEAVEGATEATSEVVEGATEATSEAVEGATEVVESATEVVEGATEATSEAVEGATEATSEAVEGASEVVEGATEAVESAMEAVEGTTEATSEAVEGVSEAAQSVVVLGEATAVDIANDTIVVPHEIITSIADITDVLSGLTDTASAEAVVPQLEQLTSQLGDWASSVDNLGEASQADISQLVNRSAEAIEQNIETMDPAVQDVLAEPLDKLLGALRGLGN